MQVINTNVMSLNAQRNLTANSTQLNTVIQRLSSGLRINSAKDDAAGLAISERFTTQIRGLNVAMRNANDGISLSQTTEGALGEISNNLQRIRELAVQARNFTNSASDRAALDSEVQQRLAEVQRTATQTSFNGQKVLDGSFLNASFQVGSNAGETIGLNLDIDARLGSIGKLATATSTAGALGAASAGGSAATGALVLGDFSVADADAVDANLTVSPLSTVFGASSEATAGIDFTAFAGFDFSTAGVNGGLGFSDDITYSGLDFSLPADEVTLEVDGYNVSLNQNYASDAALAADVASQLNTQSGGANYTVDGSVPGQFTVSRTAGTGAIASSVIGTGGGPLVAGVGAGSPGVVATAQTFTIGGNSITLNTNIADADALALEIQTQLQTYDAGYLVTEGDPSEYAVTLTGSANAADVAIAGTSAFTNGVGDIDTAGTSGSASAAASFTLTHADGVTTTAISLTGISGMGDLVTSIEGQLAGFTVTDNGDGSLTISEDGADAGSLAISVADAQADLTGFGVGDGTAVAGSAATTSTAVEFTVDGVAVSLTGDYTGDLAGLITDLGTALGDDYTVEENDTSDGVVITNAVAGSDAPELAGFNAAATAAGFDSLTTEDGALGGSVSFAAGEFLIDGVDFAGDYASVTALASAINASEDVDVFATVGSDSTLKILSSDEFEVTGTEAAAIGFSASPYSVDGDEGLSSLNVLTAAAADETILRIDEALDSVNGSRAELGAIQNRFESVIANLRTTSENLTASRSRIRDTDFASETAELTRYQILQQAGIAMLAQANQIPQNVLSLLR